MKNINLVLLSLITILNVINVFKNLGVGINILVIILCLVLLFNTLRSR